MSSILLFGIFWSVYGCLGLFGYQVIPKRYKGTKCEKGYKRFRGLSWILLGIPWLFVYIIARSINFQTIQVAMILIVCAVPSLVFSALGERKYRNLLNESV